MGAPVKPLADTSPQLAGVSSNVSHASGTAIAGNRSQAPASSSSTVRSPSADSRAANVHPALPAPTTM